MIYGPAQRSFVPVEPDSPFPIQNLPYGIFSTSTHPIPRAGVAIGGYVLDLAALEERGLLSVQSQGLFAHSSLNAFMAAGRTVWQSVRRQLRHLLDQATAALQHDSAQLSEALVPMETVTLHRPAQIQDYTDFYASREHATNVGALFRGPENALPPNWLHLPIGYHGRASSIIESSHDIRRPCGQTKTPDGDPVFGPSRRLDFELELGLFIGPGNSLGSPIPVENALDHVFGFVLLNDWSARDIQKWEYAPLGPFLGKSFATTISPWVVTLDALEAFRCPAPVQDPLPLDYLRESARATWDIHLEVGIQTRRLKAPHLVCRSNLRHLYWTAAQIIAHHTCNGCNLQTGDLLATGTISGPGEAAYGSLLEMTAGGTRAIVLPSGETRTFLEDHDRVRMTGWAQGDGYRVGFGECMATVLPALV